MEELIARLESAEGGSRELSDEVLRALGWNVLGAYGADDLDLWRSPGGLVTANPPSPTESVDDALALVPEGWGWGVRGIGNEYEAWLSCQSSEWIEAKAATPALALCAAILRATLSKDTSHE